MNQRRHFLEAAALGTTRGAAWKTPGRAGDSPNVGAGPSVDGEAGGCAIEHGFPCAVCDAKGQGALVPSAGVFST